MLYHLGVLTKNDTFGSRVLAARLDDSGRKRFTQKQVAEWFGIQPQAVYEWEKDNGFPELWKIPTLAARMGKPLSYFLEVLPDSGFAELVAALPARERYRGIPLISYVQAGSWTAAADPYPVGEAQLWLPIDHAYGESTFALEIKGASMLPRFHEHDHIIVDPTAGYQAGDFVVAKLEIDDEATFKKYRPRGSDREGFDIYELKPLNDDFSSITVNKENPARIVGVVVEHRNYRRP